MTKKDSEGDRGQGNTIACPGLKVRVDKGHQYKRWFITLKDGYESSERDETGNKVYIKFTPQWVWGELNKFCEEFYFQKEKGETTGYIHYQCAISLKNKDGYRSGQVKNMFGTFLHLELPENWHACIKYCTKIETRLEGPWSHKKKPINIFNDLNPYQLEFKKILLENKKNDRKIPWIYNPQGGIGKNQFVKWFLQNYDGVYALQNAKTSDLAYALKDDVEYVMFILPRDVDGRFNYTALESVKDGLMFSGKYESTTKCFDSPGIIVLANWGPKVKKLSYDRWEIYGPINNKLYKLEPTMYFEQFESLLEEHGTDKEKEEYYRMKNLEAEPEY